MRITPVVQLTFGVLSVTLSVLFIAISLGLVPNEDAVMLNMRTKMAENLAIQLAALAGRNDAEAIKETVDAVAERGHEIISVGLRNPDGTVFAESKNHEKEWQASSGDKASPSRVTIPLLNGDVVEGNIELLFKQLGTDANWIGLSSGIISLVAFICGAGMLGYYFVLKRSLRELDPGSAFPARVTSAFNTLAEGVLILDNNQDILLVNNAFQTKILEEPTALVGTSVSRLPWVAGESRGKTDYPWHTALQMRRPTVGVFMSLRKASGITSKLIVNATPIMSGSGAVSGVIVTFDDVTVLQQKNDDLNRANFDLRQSQGKVVEQNEQLRVLASTDSLTGCINRRTFIIKAEETMRHARAMQQSVGVLMFDIDHFKRVNDENGHATGDIVLEDVGRMLRTACDSYGFVGRYGGEEFCIIFSGLTETQIVEMAQYIRQSIAAVDTWLPGGKKVTASIGYAMLTSQNTRVADLLKMADEALYQAKANGRDQVLAWNAGASLVA